MAGSSSNGCATLPFDLVDDFYFSALFEEDEVYPISDEKYAGELQLQEVLVSSKGPLPGEVGGNVEEPLSQVNKGKGKTHEAESSSFFCGICMDRKPTSNVFRTGTCSHFFCVDCIGMYLATKMRESIIHIECPEDKCPAILEPYTCRAIVPAEVFDRWEKFLCESLILGSQKFYCPFKDCSALMVDDGGEVVTVSECPSCRRLFCAQCKVAWHVGMYCEGFLRVKECKEKEMELEVMAIKLAESKRWKKCPKCSFYVEKTEGCAHITCRCGFHFCYNCGSKWTDRHYACKI
ncbi:hypothetical protein MLD38_030788 [Melastoma candidum]|uniref:Uncharacterized protein n=1 Tax=Melastoma candidum TaxID=119954 RepID=A0ACB9MNW2_9MYRT|nr:hypothetical protein MLD38_030788 [Melastoma candidum]